MNPDKRIARIPLTPAEAADKWKPMTRGLDIQADATRVAWVLEQEVRYLRDAVDTGDNLPVPMLLKFVFPVLRRAVPNLSAKPEFSDVYEALRTAFMECLDAMNYGCRVSDMTDGAPPDYLPACAERVHDALHRLPA